MKPDMKFANELRKGDVIDTSSVASIMQLPVEDSMDIEQIKFASVRLMGLLERVLHKMGRPWTLQAKDGTVRVLTDPEAVVFRKRQNTTGVRKIRRSLVGLRGVDTNNLNAVDHASHTGILNRATSQVGALNDIARKRDASTVSKPVAPADPSRPRPPRREPVQPVVVPVPVVTRSFV